MNALFEECYQAIWRERWPALRAALCQERPKLAYYSHEDPQCLDPYFLDEASVRVAEHLQVQPGERVLDLCAAPGGKSMVLLNALAGSGFFWANDFERHARLHRVLGRFYPKTPIKLTGRDGRQMGQTVTERFDAILVDAPCSSEAHWILDPEKMQHWRSSRSSRLAINQYALLASACQMLRPGGRVLYVTCSIHPGENEAVIAKMQKRWGEQIRLDSTVPAWAEPCERGFYVLPDAGFGGPLYAALLFREPGLARM